jgi:hypothetical protein
LGVIEGVDDGVDAGGEATHASAELIVTGQHCSCLGEAAAVVLQFFSARGDFGGTPPQFGEFDEPALVEVDEARRSTTYDHPKTRNVSQVGLQQNHPLRYSKAVTHQKVDKARS